MQRLGPVARIKAMPWTNGGGMSQAVHVPPRACQYSTMLWRRKSITEMVVALSTARYSSTPRDQCAGDPTAGASANALWTTLAVRICGSTSGSLDPGFEL